jgi:hypothetical protein
MPSPFSGNDCHKWKVFLAECRIHFQAKPKMYADPVARITFAASLLEDAALKHYTIMIQQQLNSDFFQDWTEFIKNMGDLFGTPNAEHDAQRIIQNICMCDDDRFSYFIICFQEHTFDCSFNEIALKSALHNALAERLLSRLQYQLELTSYAGFVALLLQIDQRYWEIQYDINNRCRASQPKYPTTNTNAQYP